MIDYDVSTLRKKKEPVVRKVFRSTGDHAAFAVEFHIDQALRTKDDIE